MRLAMGVYEAKRRWMDKAIEGNMIPFATQTPKDPRTGKKGPPAVDFNELVNVIGVVGINEMVQYFAGNQLHESEDSIRLAVRLLLDMEKFRKGLEMRSGKKVMLARTPAESTAQTFAVKDLVSPHYKNMARKMVKGDTSTIQSLVKKRDAPVPCLGRRELVRPGGAVQADPEDLPQQPDRLLQLHQGSHRVQLMPEHWNRYA
jgi:ribonucleoside-triphosphate reductase